MLQEICNVISVRLLYHQQFRSGLYNVSRGTLVLFGRILGSLQIQGGSNMTGTDLCVNKPHKSRSYFNHLVYSLHNKFSIYNLMALILFFPSHIFKNRHRAYFQSKSSQIQFVFSRCRPIYKFHCYIKCDVSNIIV
jgi:hypothetical protein